MKLESAISISGQGSPRPNNQPTETTSPRKCQRAAGIDHPNEAKRAHRKRSVRATAAKIKPQMSYVTKMRTAGLNRPISNVMLNGLCVTIQIAPSHATMDDKVILLRTGRQAA